MATKTLGTILIVIVCILMFPVALGILGGVFGIVIGVLGAVFGAVGGLIGAIFGSIFGIFGWIVDGLFGWDFPHDFFDFNAFTVAAILILIVILSRNRSKK
jgi:hypothetical protein